MSSFRICRLYDDTFEAPPEIPINIAETKIPIAYLIKKRTAVSRIDEFALDLGRQSNPGSDIICVGSLDTIGEHAPTAFRTRKKRSFIETTAGPLKMKLWGAYHITLGLGVVLALNRPGFPRE